MLSSVRLLIATAMLVSACSPPETNLFAERAGQTALFIIDAPAAQPVLYAKRLPAGMQTFPIEVEPMSRITVVLYQGTPEELQLPTEPMKEVPSGRLPPTPFEAAHAGTYRQHDVADWEPIDELPQVFLPAFDYRRCAKLGGCLTEQDVDLGRERCTLPCPFEPLEAVTPPTPPSFAYCPPSSEALDCENRLPELTDCADDEMGLFEGGCARVGTTCSPNGWPTVRPPNAVYVRAGSNGTGTENDPFPNIQTAVAQGADTILLARGEHGGADDAIALPITSSVTIIGACAATGGSVITNHFHSHGFLSLKNMRIDNAAVVVAEGELHLEDIIIDGSYRRALNIWKDAVVVGKRIVVKSSGPWNVYVAGSAQLSQIDIRGISGIDVSTGTLDLSDVVVVAEEAFRSMGLLTMRRGRFRFNGSGLNFMGASSRASIEDIVMEGNGAGVIIEGGQLSAKRMVIQDSFIGIQAEGSIETGLDNEKIQFEDLAILNTESPVTIHRTITTSIARATITGFDGENGIYALYSMTSSTVPDCQLVLNDITLNGAGHRGIWSRIPIEISRASITMSGSNATSVDRGIYLLDTGVLRNISVNSPGHGITISSDARQTLVGERISIKGGKHGVRLTLESAARLSQVQIEHADIGLHVGTLAHVKLEQFGVGFCSTGIEIGEGELSKGEIYNNDIGIHSSREIIQSLTGIRFRDNQEDVQ